MLQKHPFSPRVRKHIIPAILAHSQAEFVQKLTIIKKRYPKQRFQVDVLDSTFVPYTSWCEARAIAQMRLKHFDVHLMIKNPERHIKHWRLAGADRIFFHYESTHNPMRVLRAIRAERMYAGIAINPETDVSTIQLLLPHLDAILLMGEHPGYGGQPFCKSILTKIKKMRALTSSIPIIIDGGVTGANAPLLLKAGASELASGHAALLPFEKKL